MPHYSFKVCTAVFIFSLISTNTQAQETNFSYTQLSIAGTYTDFDDSIYLYSGPNSISEYSDIGGIAVSGSYQFQNNFTLSFDGSYQESSNNFSEINATQSLFTGGYIFPATPNMDIYLQGGITFAESEICELFSCASVDDTGNYLSIGGRAWASSWLELNTRVSRVSFDDFFEGGTSIHVGGAGWFNDSSSVFVNFGFSSDSNASLLGYRYTY